MSVKNGRVPPERSVERDGREDAQKRAIDRAILMAARNATARIRTSRHVAEMNKVFKTMSDPRLSDQRLYGSSSNGLDEWASEHTGLAPTGTYWIVPRFAPSVLESLTLGSDTDLTAVLMRTIAGSALSYIATLATNSLIHDPYGIHLDPHTIAATIATNATTIATNATTIATTIATNATEMATNISTLFNNSLDPIRNTLKSNTDIVLKNGDKHPSHPANWHHFLSMFVPIEPGMTTRLDDKMALLMGAFVDDGSHGSHDGSHEFAEAMREDNYTINRKRFVATPAYRQHVEAFANIGLNVLKRAMQGMKFESAGSTQSKYDQHVYRKVQNIVDALKHKVESIKLANSMLKRGLVLNGEFTSTVASAEGTANGTALSGPAGSALWAVGNWDSSLLLFASFCVFLFIGYICHIYSAELKAGAADAADGAALDTKNGEGDRAEVHAWNDGSNHFDEYMYEPLRVPQDIAPQTSEKLAAEIEAICQRDYEIELLSGYLDIYAYIDPGIMSKKIIRNTMWNCEGANQRFKEHTSTGPSVKELEDALNEFAKLKEIETTKRSYEPMQASLQYELIEKKISFDTEYDSLSESLESAPDSKVVQILGELSLLLVDGRRLDLLFQYIYSIYYDTKGILKTDKPNVQKNVAPVLAGLVSALIIRNVCNTSSSLLPFASMSEILRDLTELIPSIDHENRSSEVIVGLLERMVILKTNLTKSVKQAILAVRTLLVLESECITALITVNGGLREKGQKLLLTLSDMPEMQEMKDMQDMPFIDIATKFCNREVACIQQNLNTAFFIVQGCIVKLFNKMEPDDRRQVSILIKAYGGTILPILMNVLTET
tara:strand:- start:638 stop:3145 length:2508 start_codon:yes stop_codon:yes gene_type:complete